ncbi:hypothetical protein B0H10DRAFT_2044737 [Mycena sp. CBHHK59/15]|nr:hypothetical protein B0H10DRAFT_2044737 [Mycena sp. CBHHK59/15]
MLAAQKTSSTHAAHSTSPATSPRAVEQNLPPSVEDLRQNYITTVQATAVVTTLFAGIQAQLLSGIPSEPSPTASQPIVHALLLASYGDLAVNVGAALSSMIFLDIVGEAPQAFRLLQQKTVASGHTAPSDSALSPHSQPEGSPHTSNEITPPNRDAEDLTGLKLLVSHGTSPTIQLAWYHCVASTVVGTLSILLQISLLAWINISTRGSGVFACIVLALVWASLPLPGYFVYNFFLGFFSGLKREMGW